MSLEDYKEIIKRASKPDPTLKHSWRNLYVQWYKDTGSEYPGMRFFVNLKNILDEHIQSHMTAMLLGVED